MHKYHLTYDVTPHPEGIEKSEIPEGHGGCDALVVGSIIYPEDGSYSCAVLGMDGRTGKELSSAELFKFWALMTHQLSEDKTLTPGKRDLCSQVHTIIKESILRSRAPAKEPT